MTDSSPVRVALVNCGGLLGDIIRQAVAAEPDFEVVADVTTEEPPEPVLEADPDILVWNNAAESELAAWLEKIARRCGVSILATRGDGRSAALWEVVPRRSPLESLSPSTIVEMIRTSAAHRVAP